MRSIYLAVSDLDRLDYKYQTAVGIAVWERVLAFYSSYFRESFLHCEVIDFCWRYVEKGNDVSEAAAALEGRVGALIDRACEEGYPINCMLPSVNLLRYVARRNSQDIIAMVDNVSVAYAASQLFSIGLPLDNPVVTFDGVDAIAEIAYRFALNVFDSISALPPHTLCHSQLESFPQIPCAKLEIPRQTMLECVPSHERRDRSANHS